MVSIQTSQETALLQYIDFNLVENWSVQYLKGTNFSYNENFDLISIGDFLTRNKTQIDIQDEKEYKRVTIKINNGGVFLRDIKIGKEIGTKKQFTISKGQFLLSKIDARNGAFGVVPEEIDGAIITGNFWTFDVDYSKINPHFLSLLVTTPEFIMFSENASNGTTNRHYLQEDLFLNVKIPLPELKEQNRIVESYQENISDAEEAQSRSEKLEGGIERYLIEELGIKVSERKEKKLLQFLDFSRLNRWDNWAFNSYIKADKFPLVTFGEAFNFTSRSWSKKSHIDKEFNYIELGGVDELQGITKIKTLKVSDAPSRATQTVKEGDLIIGTTRPYLKRFAIVSKKYNGNICSSGFCVIQQGGSYNLEFLLEFLKSSFGVEQLKNNMSGALYPAITTKKLKENILIPKPPIEIQEKIVSHIGAMKDEIKALREKAEHLRESAKREFEKEIFS